ncbi:hypothetical protein LG200_00440 [Methylobacillus caricis]|uniref:hypothetical protein n=1 Tax=Methylobacillus caricis TaxID=1971611 RepID=UPI001D000A50|nr:hypothetical protein [Methylobacillus caricis]MCB5186470.1 hypothetical protein [Methylobacillus caricis]
MKPSLSPFKMYGTPFTTRSIMVGGGLAFLVFLVLAYVFFNEQEMPQNGTLMQRIQFISPNVTEVHEISDRIEIAYLNKNANSSAGWFDDFFMEALHISRNLRRAGKGKQFAEIAFMVQVPSGKGDSFTGSSLGMKVFYDGKILQNADLITMDQYQFAEMARQVHYQRLGRIKAQEYCNESAGYKRTPHLCGFLVEGYIKGRRLN